MDRGRRWLSGSLYFIFWRGSHTDWLCAQMLLLEGLEKVLPGSWGLNPGHQVQSKSPSHCHLPCLFSVSKSSSVPRVTANLADLIFKALSHRGQAGDHKVTAKSGPLVLTSLLPASHPERAPTAP